MYLRVTQQLHGCWCESGSYHSVFGSDPQLHGCWCVSGQCHSVFVSDPLLHGCWCVSGQCHCVFGRDPQLHGCYLSLDSGIVSLGVTHSYMVVGVYLDSVIVSL